jgi:hypothetical protein
MVNHGMGNPWLTAESHRETCNDLIAANAKVIEPDNSAVIGNTFKVQSSNSGRCTGNSFPVNTALSLLLLAVFWSVLVCLLAT